MLAELPSDALRALYPDGELLPAQTEKTITDRAVLERRLAEARKRGYATNTSESEVGVAAISAVVRDRRGGAIAALSVAAPVSRMTAQRTAEIGATVREHAERLGRLLPD